MKKFLITFLLLAFIGYAKENQLFTANVIQIPPNTFAIVVSKSHQQLFVFKQQSDFPEKIDEFIAITGARFGDKKRLGDLRTPSGVYFPVKYKDGKYLPSYYGIGAYPLNYPNALDRYIIKRDGDGIWIHASNKDKLLFFSSKGCVILNNKSFSKLSKYIKLKKTPIVIQENFYSLPKKEFMSLKEKINTFLSQWEKALYEIYNHNTIPMYSLYAEDFKSALGDRYKQIKWYKENLFSEDGNKPFIHLLSKTILYDRRSNGRKYFVVKFTLVFLKGNKAQNVEKILYIEEKQNGLKIVSEEIL